MAACGGHDNDESNVKTGPDVVDLSDLNEIREADEFSVENVTDDAASANLSGAEEAAGVIRDGNDTEPDRRPPQASVRVLTSQNAQQMIHKAVGILQQAMEKEKSKEIKDAFSLYKQGIELLLTAYKVPSLSQKAKQVLHAKIKALLSKAEHLKDHVLKNQSSESCSLCRCKGKVDEEAQQADEFYTGFIVTANEKRTFDDIIGSTASKESLKEYLVLPLKFPQLFRGVRQSSKTVLLFGHPGTGKTLLMSAIAGEVPDCTFIKLSVFDFLSKFRAEAEKNVKDLFRFARERAPCVICIEDVDRLEDPNTGPEERSHNWRLIKTELLVQLHEIFSDHSPVRIVFITQKPWCLTAMLRRRLHYRILQDLPTKEERVNILKSNMSKVHHNLTDKDFGQLGDRTLSIRGYRCTQADLTVLCRDAMMQTVRKIQQAKYFKQVDHPKTQEEGFWTPCCHDDDGSVEMTWMDMEGGKLLEPHIEMGDFLQSLEKFQGTVDADEEHKMQEWVENFTSLRDER